MTRRTFLKRCLQETKIFNFNQMRSNNYIHIVNTLLSMRTQTVSTYVANNGIRTESKNRIKDKFDNYYRDSTRSLYVNLRTGHQLLNVEAAPGQLDLQASRLRSLVIDYM